MRKTVGFMIAASLCAPQIASAFNAPGNEWPMSSYPVHYRLHPDGAPGVTDGSDLTMIRKAFQTWEDVACSDLRFIEQQWMEPSIVQGDGVNRIYWATERDDWPGQPTTLALTFTFFRTADSVITDADMVGNGVDWEWTTVDGMITQRRVDLETVVFHEIGHYFGLQHSGDANAAMFPSNNVPIRRGPANDDIAGICTLYANGQPIPNSASSDPGAVGQPCQRPEDCASSLCANDDGTSYCTDMCNPATPNACPVQFPCTRTSQGDFCLTPVITEELCDQCSEGNQCSTGLCLTVPGFNFFRPFCTQACDPSPGGPPQCPQGYQCEAVQSGGQTGGVCAPSTGTCNPEGKGGHNEPCFANGGCKTGHTCIQYFEGSGLNFCYFECNPRLAGVSCSDSGRIICQNVPIGNAFGRMNVAACFSIAGVGEPCIPEACQSGSVCAFDENAGIDSAICYQTCPAGACQANNQCQFFEGLGNLCIPGAGFLPLGASCLADEECVGKTCRTYGTQQLCTQDCATTDPMGCEPGLRCIAAANQTAGLCWPEASIVPTNRGEPVTPPAGYCYCDTTSQCEAGCDCDPECGAANCSCQTSGGSGSSGHLGWSLLFLAAIWGSTLRTRRARRLARVTSGTGRRAPRRGE